MATLLDNRTLMVGLALLALWYYFSQKKPYEGLDAVVAVTDGGTQVQVNQETVAKIPASQPATVLIQGTQSGQIGQQQTQQQGLYAQAMSSTEGINQTVAPQGSVPPAPLTAITSETLLAAVPPGMANLPSESPFTAEGTDYSQIFGEHDDLDPAELIPKDLPDIYAEYNKPDPTMAGNLLMNAYQHGIETSSAKRNWVADIRKIHPVPTGQVSPWLNSTTVPPDTTRRSVGDVE